MNTLKKEIKETVPFITAFKIIIYPGMNLSKVKKNLYTENSKTLLKVINENLNKWTDTLCSWIGG